MCGGEPEEDKSVYLALILRRKEFIRIEAAFAIFFQGGNDATDLRWQITHHLVGKLSRTRAAGKETRLGRFDTSGKEVTAPIPVTTIRRRTDRHTHRQPSRTPGP